MSDLGSIGIVSQANRSPTNQISVSGIETKSSRSPTKQISVSGIETKSSMYSTTQSVWAFSLTGSDSNNIKLFYETDLKLRLSSITCNRTYMVLGVKDTTNGNPSSPSLRMDADGKWRFRWKVEAGLRTIQVGVKQGINQDPRPTLVIKSRPEAGINEDVTGSAPSSTDWTTIGPISISPVSNSVVWVELHNNFQSQPYLYPCYWDHVVTT